MSMFLFSESWILLTLLFKTDSTSGICFSVNLLTTRHYFTSRIAHASDECLSVRAQSDLEPAQPDDGLLEIVGLRDGWHTAFVMISVITAIRLCQVP